MTHHRLFAKHRFGALIYIGIALFAGSCTPRHPRLQAGDLLFQQTRPSAMGEAIGSATGTEKEPVTFTHVALVTAVEPEIELLEASPARGVAPTTLTEFLNDSRLIAGRPAVVAMRLRDTTGTAEALVRARTFIGQPYDFSYRPDNGRLYCSELLYESFLTPEGRHRFPVRPMNFRSADGSMPAFWEELFARNGEAVPEGIPGTNPNDMAADPQLVEIGRWY